MKYIELFKDGFDSTIVEKIKPENWPYVGYSPNEGLRLSMILEENQSGYQMVDLGLSVKWATFNVGATKPEEYGDYFAWGETEPKENYDWSTYKHCNGSKQKLTRYCNNISYGNNGFTDNENQFYVSEDDAAIVNCGGDWRMPTDADWKELRNNCTWTWTTQNGVNGYTVTSYNGNSIFLPAAGYYNGSSLKSAGSYGNYWANSCRTDYSYYAWYVYFGSSNVAIEGGDRCYGQSVRPVCP